MVLYLHMHQPMRIRHFTIFDVGVNADYFQSTSDDDTNNQRVLDKIIEKSYSPTLDVLGELLQTHPEFQFSLSISGTLIEQLENCDSEIIPKLRSLVETRRVEIVGETYHHSLTFFYDQQEFETQVNMHAQKIQHLFGVTPTAFRNTELAYNNQLASWAESRGYKVILAEGWDPILGWRSPNFVYRPPDTHNIRLLLKNYKLSDDIAFRFGDKKWSGWPLTVDKFNSWANAGDGTNINLFMDFETFGEHQWEDTGIFDFLKALPGEWLKTASNNFMTISKMASSQEPVDVVDMPNTVTWADTERDLSAWLGNPMQRQAIQSLYELGGSITNTQDLELIEDWRKLQTSDHFYYMCTKWFNDGDIHAYFSPYQTPYEAFINFMNSYHSLRARLIEKGVQL